MESRVWDSSMLSLYPFHCRVVFCCVGGLQLLIQFPVEGHFSFIQVGVMTVEVQAIFWEPPHLFLSQGLTCFQLPCRGCQNSAFAHFHSKHRVVSSLLSICQVLLSFPTVVPHGTELGGGRDQPNTDSCRHLSFAGLLRAGTSLTFPVWLQRVFCFLWVFLLHIGDLKLHVRRHAQKLPPSSSSSVGGPPVSALRSPLFWAALP